jgi:lysophospholipase L1-like esterase
MSLRLARVVFAAGLLVPAGRALTADTAFQPPAIEFQSGDRVVFIGDSFFEREYPLGLIETALTASHPDKALTFRNIGWSGDTVRGEARANFGTPLDGYAALVKAVDVVTPSVLFLSYGANESFDGEPGLEAFLADYRKLLGDVSSPARRIVLLTPLPADARTSPLPAAALEARNRVLSRYSEAIRSLAAERGFATIDLFSAMLASMSRSQAQPLFVSGMHLTPAGYALAARHIAARTMPSAPVPSGLDEQLTDLRTLIVQKNELFFHRWRPANVTYLYLFRQREQGKNAVEMARFDPLIAEKERAIAAVRKGLAPATGAGGPGDRR